MTSRHEGWVSTMLTGSNFSIALPVRHFKGLYDENGGCKPKSTAFRVLSVWTSRGCDGSGSRKTYLLSPICIKPRRSAWIHRFGQTPWCPTRREWHDAPIPASRFLEEPGFRRRSRQKLRACEYSRPQRHK